MLALFFLASCISLSYSPHSDEFEAITIEILKPSSIELPDSVQAAVISDFSLIRNTEKLRHSKTGRSYKFFRQDSIGAAQTLTKLYAKLSKSPRLDSVAIDTARLSEKDTAINWAEISRVCERHKAQALILLENFQIDYQIEATPELYFVRRYQTEHTLSVFADIKATFRIYLPESKKVLDKYDFSKVIVWRQYSNVNLRRLNVAPHKQKALNAGTTLLSELYSQRVAPVWVSQNRYIYLSENQDMKRAEDFARKGKWTKAAAIWEKFLEHQNPDLAEQAGYNMALVYEIQDKLKKAYETARQTDKTHSLREARRYAKVLKERMLQRQRLKKLLGNEQKP